MVGLSVGWFSFNVLDPSVRTLIQPFIAGHCGAIFIVPTVHSWVWGAFSGGLSATVIFVAGFLCDILTLKLGQLFLQISTIDSHIAHKLEYFLSLHIELIHCLKILYFHYSTKFNPNLQ